MVMKPVKPLELEANHPDDLTSFTFLCSSSVEFFCGQASRKRQNSDEYVFSNGTGRTKSHHFHKNIRLRRIYLSQSFLAECFTEIYGRAPLVQSSSLILISWRIPLSLVVEPAGTSRDDGGPAGRLCSMA